MGHGIRYIGEEDVVDTDSVDHVSVFEDAPFEKFFFHVFNHNDWIYWIGHDESERESGGDGELGVGNRMCIKWELRANQM